MGGCWSGEKLHNGAHNRKCQYNHSVVPPKLSLPADGHNTCARAELCAANVTSPHSVKSFPSLGVMWKLHSYPSASSPSAPHCHRWSF
jgi:hypothetical protein